MSTIAGAASEIPPSGVLGALGEGEHPEPKARTARPSRVAGMAIVAIVASARIVGAGDYGPAFG
jgi:hypothetical protein